MNLKTGLPGLLLILILNSCVSYKEFSVEVFKPAELSIPANTKNIVLVSRNLKYKNDTLQNYYQRNRQLIRDKINLNIDSLAVSTCLDTLASRLTNHGHFEQVQVLPVTTFSKIWVSDIKPPKAEWYKSVAEKSGADVLVLLDMFSCFYSTNAAESSPEARVVTSNIWSVYNAKDQQIIDRFSQIDTLYWNQLDENGNYQKEKIPDKKNAIELAAGVIGVNYSKHILPAWTQVKRTYLSFDDPNFQKALKFAQDNQWEQAIGIWLGFSEGKSNFKKASAFYNLAVASEMNGDIDKAIEFTDKAAKASTGLFLGSVNEQVRKYSVILYQRKNEINKLNRQYETH